MTLKDIRTVDAIGIEPNSNNVVLHILDSSEWDDVTNHLLLLQEKINAYFDFIETGEIFETYPDAKDRQIIINIIERFDPPESFYGFYKKAQTVGKGFDVYFRWELRRGEGR